MMDSAASMDELVRLYFLKGYSYRLILCFLFGVHGIRISLRTLKRSLKRQGLKRKGHSVAQTSDLMNCVQLELDGSGDNVGYRMMQKKLLQKYNLTVSRERVREVLLILDPEGVALRRKRRLRRRIYSSPGPNFCWHIDGNDKLLPFGFGIHCCVESSTCMHAYTALYTKLKLRKTFSRKVLWLEVASSNKDSGVVAGYYLSTVKKYGCPKIIRADRGTENVKVAYLQPFLRRHGNDETVTKSFMYGRSVSNQRVEQFWSTLRKLYTDWWIEFFKLLKRDGYYDDSDLVEFDCLKFSFMQLIQKELNEARDIWNTHLISKQSRVTISGIPDELYHLAEMRGYQDYASLFDEDDMVMCVQHAKEKPAVASKEFLNLVNILMEEDNINMPSTPLQGLELYFTLVDSIKNAVAV